MRRSTTDYYTRFGFRADPRLSLADLPPAYFLCLPLGSSVPAGVVTYDPAFSEPAATD